LPRTIGLMMPLLQEPLINPHATLITLLMNIVDEDISDQDRMADAAPQSPTAKRLLKYLLLEGLPPNNHSDPRIIKHLLPRDIVGTYEHIFDK
jgi:hypothetical protein